MLNTLVDDHTLFQMDSSDRAKLLWEGHYSESLT